MFTSVHNHSEYSNLRFCDCPIKAPLLIDKAIELGYSGLCLTDHEAVSGHLVFLKHYKQLKKDGKLPDGFRIGLGNEIYLLDREAAFDTHGVLKDGVKFYHFILIAKDRKGHDQLRQLSTEAWNGRFRQGPAERVPTYRQTIEQVLEHDPGHLIASTACLGGELANLILKHEGAKPFVKWMVDVFGKGNVFLEIQPREPKKFEETHDQIKVNQAIAEISGRTGIPLIVTTDTHYLTKDDRYIHEAFLQSDPTNHGNRELADFYEYTYMMDEQEILSMLKTHLPADTASSAIDNTQLVHDMLEDYELEHPIIVPVDRHIPTFKVRHIFREWYDKYPYIKEFAFSDEEQDKYFLHLIENGFEQWDQEFNDVNLARINEELETMALVSEKLGQPIASYYVLVREMIHNILWKRSFVGVARGSVTGFYTAYLIGITQINPIDYGLNAWRHLHFSRIELPDIDLDIGSTTRQNVFEDMKDYYGRDCVLQTATFRTLSSKSAALAACLGVRVADDEAHVIADMIPFERGSNWPLSDCFEGNPEHEREPIHEFISAVDAYFFRNLKDVMLQLEGVVCGRGIHASSQYIFNQPFVNQNSMMRSSNGACTTAFNMTDSDSMGALKMDLLVIEAMDKLMATINLLISEGVIEDKGSLKANYDAYIHPSVLDYDDPRVWDIIANSSIPDLFQCDTDVGRQAMKKIKPVTVMQMAAANSLMRLMPQNGEISPIDIYVAYKEDISKWYREMELAGLNKNEIEVLEPLLLPEYGVAAVQETIMQLVMDPKIAGFTMTEANMLRKAVAKKKPKLIEETKELYYRKGKEIGTSKKMLDYVWNKQISRQLGYSFSINHTVPYSIIAIQEATLAARYGPLYWGAATMSVNAGAIESDRSHNTDYSKIACAVNNLQASGIKIALPDINKARMDFAPGEDGILFALKAVRGVNEEQANIVIANRPYDSFDDFMNKADLPNGPILQLIKAGAFDKLEPDMTRRELMMKYLSSYKKSGASPLAKLTMRNLPEILRVAHYDDRILKRITAEDLEIPDYAARLRKNIAVHGTKASDTWCYVRDEDAHESFFYSIFAPHLKEERDYKYFRDGYTIVKIAAFNRAVQKATERIKAELLQDPEVLELVNQARAAAYMKEKCVGNQSTWEMNALLFYEGPHELDPVDKQLYHIEDFNSLPSTPKVAETLRMYGRTVYRYELTRIAGTVLCKDKDSHKITLLTPTGLVVVKLYKNDFIEYNRQISSNDDSDEGDEQSAEIIEKSWFVRGNKLLITGFRRGDMFMARDYSSSVLKGKVMLIQGLHNGSKLILKKERGDEEHVGIASADCYDG